MSSVAAARRVWTCRDLAALPEDHLRHELIDGEHVVTASPGTVHQRVLLNLVRILLPCLDKRGLGRMLLAPFDVKLSLFTVVVPDIAYVTAERFARVVTEKHATAAADDVRGSPLFPGLRIPLREGFRGR
jgi:Uma2 family endonuclease